ncbi:MAG: D-alanyl-D-alanine carboxypeptidase [Propionibacteriaceae bacterium]|nr:D-alanyl-D-alanine carboxypeptidase [Propionibacteriaceae bacterium]
MAYSRFARLTNRVVVPGVLAITVVGTALWGLTAGTTAGGQPSVDPTRYATPAPTPVPVDPQPAFAVAAGALPDAAALAAGLAALPRAGAGRTGWAVIDPASGQVLAQGDGDQALTPASNWKLLTSLAVLDRYGFEHRFATRVVQSGGRLTLVGGGDPYLADASAGDYPQGAALATLADATAAALPPGGAVELGWDDSLFAGPGWNSAWEEGDELWVTPTSALWVDRGISGGVHSATPAADAAARFAELLVERGLQVAQVGAGTAPDEAVTVAQVWSPTLGVIVQECLRTSDNDVAEVLFRHLGTADGGDGSITAAQAGLVDGLRRLGLWDQGMVAVDGSGLSYADQATAAVIARAVARSLADPAYRDLAVGLPVAGGYGTLSLAWRYDDPEEDIARGTVRAKTGTLTGVNSLGGFVRTTSGAVVAFGFICNDIADDTAARDWLDHATALVAAS